MLRHQIVCLCEFPISLDSAPERRVYYICNELRKYGIHSIIIPERAKLPKFALRENSIAKNLRRIYICLCMITLLLRERVEWCYSRSFYLVAVSIILAKIFRLKTIYDFHGYVYQEEKYRGHRFKPILTMIMERFCLRYADVVVTQTRSNEAAISYHSANILVLENGIDNEDFARQEPRSTITFKYGIPNTKPIVGFVGNWEKWMNITDLLEASQYLNDVCVVIVGRGKNLEKYKKESKNVIFTDKIPHEDLVSLLATFEVCVAPYSEDAILQYKSAVKTLEYIAAGKPIVISNVVGRESFLKDGENCLLYEAGDPADLAAKIKRLLKDETLRNKIARNNRKIAGRFTWERVIEKSRIVDMLTTSI